MTKPRIYFSRDRVSVLGMPATQIAPNLYRYDDGATVEIEPGATVSPEIIAGAARAWDQTYVATDWALMLDLWRSIDPANKSLALEMADADRRRAQTRVRT